MPASALAHGDAVKALDNVPPLISARSANTLISENRPTRIQAETLLILNGLLDELLLAIISSAKSLATDRIKTDGVLKVLGSNLLAKDAVLEAELELRSYLESRRAEGARVPLGLMATSRLDGTDGFPVENAYKALRTRCLFYSTLSDSNADDAPKDQNIMSSDGRPIATVTPGAAVYVTALLEYIGEHILQNVSRVIERDNSDEASLYDLRAAITEDEQLNPLFAKLSIRSELTRRIDVLESRRRKITEDGAGRGVRSDARVVKPWHVPTENDFDEAAGPNLFSSKRVSMPPAPRSDNALSSATSSSRHGHGASSSIGQNDSVRDSISTLRTTSSVANNGTFDSTAGRPQGNGSVGKQSSTRPSTGRQDGTSSNPNSAGPRPSSERTWSGVFGAMKRRNSFKQGSEATSTPGRPVLQTESSFNSNQVDSALEPEDDFEALMLSGQTMKVSLTPNRLHTIEVAQKGQDAPVGSVGRRAGTTGVREDLAPPAAAFGRESNPSPGSQMSTIGDQLPDGAGSGGERPSTGSTTPPEAVLGRPASRTSMQQTTLRPERKLPAPPPSSYRSPSPALLGQHNLPLREEEGAVAALPPHPSLSRRSAPRLLPRDDEADSRTSTSKDLVDLFKSTPPSATSERFSIIGSDTSSLADGTSKKSAMGDRVRLLFGRKSSSNTGHASPSSPRQRNFLSHQRTDTKASLEDSQDTHVTSSTTNSIGQRRSVVSPYTAPSDQHGASRSSTSTSEHRPFKAEAAVEAKPLPDVSVVEPELAPNLAAIGLGVGIAAADVGAAGPVVADRIASPASRTTSYASQTTSTAEGPVPEEATADDSSSTSRSTKPTEELVSRKVPWGYKRASVGAGTMIDRATTPNSDRRKSPGYQSSNGHGVLPVRSPSGMASSENSHSPRTAAMGSPYITSSEEGTTPANSTAVAPRGNNAPTAWSGSGSQTLARRRSFGSRPLSTTQAHRTSLNLETIQLLADLERAMRNCHSVDECRALVHKAMHSDGAASAPTDSQVDGVTDEKETREEGKAAGAACHADGAVVAGTGTGSVATAVGAVAAAETTGTPSANSEASKGSRVAQSAATNGHASDAKAGHKILDVKTLLADTSTSLEQVDQGLIAAWLLGGDESPTCTRDGSSDKLSSLRRELSQEQAATRNGSAAEQPASLDSSASRDATRGRASSSVASVRSNYKDASEEVTVE